MKDIISQEDAGLSDLIHSNRQPFLFKAGSFRVLLKLVLAEKITQFGK
jgi:hypothetical protein